MPPKGYSTKLPRVCGSCGVTFFIYPYKQHEKGRGQYCSVACYRAPRKCIVPISASIAYVPLGDEGEEFALIDSWNVAIAESTRWTKMSASSRELFYAKSQGILLHRLIANTPDGFHTDHANNNGLDDRECNLRICTPSHNAANSRIHGDNLSGFKGVKPSGKKWQANIRCNGTAKYLGTFATKEEASSAYAEAAKTLFGEFARS